MSILTLEFHAARRSSALTGKILAAYRAFQAKRTHRLASRALSAMEDHMLKDIGISRSEIPMAVYGLKIGRGERADHGA